MNRYNVEIRQIHSNEELPQYIPIFKIYKGENGGQIGEISVSNANHVNIDFEVFTGGYNAPRAEYTFVLVSTSTTEGWKYYLRAKKQETNMLCYTTEDNDYVYVVVKAVQKYRSLYVKFDKTAAVSPFTMCSYADQLDNSNYTYIYKEAITQECVIIDNAMNNITRSIYNSIMNPNALSAKNPLIRFLEISTPDITTERVPFDSYNKFVYGELVLYIAGIGSTTAPSIVRICLSRQSVSDGGVVMQTLVGTCPYTIRWSYDENGVYAYLSGDQNSRPTIGVLACNMLYGSAKINLIETTEMTGTEFSAKVVE